MAESNDRILREQLLALLEGGHAHQSFDQVVADFPLDQINTRPPNVPYTFWHLVEHLRITQWDILDYIRNTNYVWMRWPDDYWPRPEEQADPVRWNDTLNRFRADLAALQALVRDPATDLTAPLPHAPQHTILREVLLAADHNAYHIGELGILRQVNGLWPV